MACRPAARARAARAVGARVITSYSIHYTKLYDLNNDFTIASNSSSIPFLLDRTNTELTTATLSGTQIEVYGTISWEDIKGKPHPASNVKVEIYDDDFITAERLSTVYTDINGAFSVVLNNDNSDRITSYNVCYTKLLRCWFL